MEINATLIGQLITFIVLVLFTMKYVWPPITKAMLEREKKIAAGLEASDRSKHELEAAQQKRLSIIREAKAEAMHIVEQAHQRSIQMVDEAKENARLEANRVIEVARNNIALEVNQAKEALRQQLAGLAIAGAEKIIKRNLDVSTNTALLDEFVAEI